ncbi:hypothetical protein CASFOL_038363 [Castilleja foliolosa]|uniref:AAA+ ATPase domain-containing protein n=1 Tax=Castilleja foliolosa TaxID=1961234 RepID=A0ABD3BL76_9LAMI
MLMRHKNTIKSEIMPLRASKSISQTVPGLRNFVSLAPKVANNNRHLSCLPTRLQFLPENSRRICPTRCYSSESSADNAAEEAKENSTSSNSESNADNAAEEAKENSTSSNSESSADNSTSVTGDRMDVPQASLELAIMRLKELEKEKKRLKSPKDLARGKYEKAFVSSVISPDDIGIKFDDVGALETVKNALDELVILPMKKPGLFSRGNLRRPCKGLLLFGPPGTGKTLIAKAVATEAGAHFINVTPSSIANKWLGEEEKLARGLFSFARKLAPVVIFIDEIDSLLGARGRPTEHEATRSLRNEIMLSWDGLTSKESERVLVLGATNRPFDIDDAVIRRMPRRIYVGLPDLENRSKILKVHLANEELEPGFSLEQLAAATEGYSGSDLKNLCLAAAYKPVQDYLRESKSQGGDGGDEVPALRPLALDDFIQSKAQVAPSVADGTTSLRMLQEWNERFGEGGSRPPSDPSKKKSPKDLASCKYEKAFVSSVISPDDIGVKFDDVGALETVKKALDELVILPMKKPGLFSRGNLSRPCRGLLLFGPPGTGKTLIAKAVASEAGAHFINVTASSIKDCYHGEGEKLARALFSLARKLAPAVIFIDEIDSLLGARGGRTEHEATRSLRNEIMLSWDGLTSKESERVLVLGATNRPFDIDDAVIRRMPRRVYVGLPDLENRSKILKVHLAKEELEPGFSLKQLAAVTEGYSGSDLKNLCLAAAYKPVQDYLQQESKGGDEAPALRPLTLDDFIQSKAQVAPSVADSTTSLRMLQEWNERFGEGGSRPPVRKMGF